MNRSILLFVILLVVSCQQVQQQTLQSLKGQLTANLCHQNMTYTSNEFKIHNCTYESDGSALIFTFFYQTINDAFGGLANHVTIVVRDERNRSTLYSADQQLNQTNHHNGEIFSSKQRLDLAFFKSGWNLLVSLRYSKTSTANKLVFTLPLLKFEEKNKEVFKTSSLKRIKSEQQ